MPLSIPVSPAAIMVEPLSAKAFAPFGHVIEDPKQTSMHGEHNHAEPVQVNQGTALKYENVSPFDDFYEAAPSQCKAIAVINQFVCTPRRLRSVQAYGRGWRGDDVTSVAGPESEPIIGLYDLTLMERHPYTTQTFIPIGLASSNAETAFLVVVAPTLPTMQHTGDFPDVSGVRAFFARGSQAVTYSAATWHAPMIVVGVKPISFIVIQNSNGVAEEDCEEIEFITAERTGIIIVVPSISSISGDLKL